jgi:hypothetical protein
VYTHKSALVIKMRLRRNDVDLFLATVSTFVASLPGSPRQQPLDPLKAPEDIILDNRTEELRFEIGCLPDSLSRTRAERDLSSPEFDDAAEALRNILQLMNECVDGICDGSGSYTVGLTFLWATSVEWYFVITLFYGLLI